MVPGPAASATPLGLVRNAYSFDFLQTYYIRKSGAGDDKQNFVF